jgi:hypothetical protein
MITVERQSPGGKLVSGEVKPSLRRYFVPAMIAVFFIALIVRLYANFYTSHDNCAFVGDANEYVREAIVLSAPVLRSPEFVKDALAIIQGNASAEALAHVHATTVTFAELHRAGPLYPLTIWGYYALFGRAVSFVDWASPILCTSILSSLICVLIALTTKNLWNEKAGLVAGLLACSYPGFIFSSGTLYSETYTAFSISLLCWGVSQSMSDNKPGNFVSFLMGLCMASLWLTRPPAMVVIAVVLPFLVYARWQRKAAIPVATFFLGFLLIILPFCAFQKVAFNKVTGFVERSANYNLVMGNNYSTLGWLAYPYPNVKPAWDGGAKYVLKYGLQHLNESLPLQIDKVLRLVKFPFSDFRTPIGPVQYAGQVYVHQVMLLFALIGLSLGLLCEIKNRTDLKRAIARLSVLLIGLHGFAYLAFIAMNRYFLPACPVLIIFSAVGMVELARRLQQSQNRSMSVTTIFCLIVLMLTLQINLVPVLLQNGITDNVSVAFILTVAIKAVPVACLGVLLILLQMSSREFVLRNNTLTARLQMGVTIALLLLCLPLASFPARASGRRFETAVVLDKPGQKITQQIDCDSTKLEAGSRMYLFVDVANYASLDGLQFFVNGRKTGAERIPGFSVVPDYSSYRTDSGGVVSWEGENIFDCLSVAAGSSNADVRQWYIVPLDVETTKSVVSKGSALVDVEKTNFTTSTTYSEFAYRKNSYTLPSVDLYSWEKTFYAVENVQDWADPRYDERARRLHTMLLNGQNPTGAPQAASIRLVVAPNLGGIEKPESSGTGLNWQSKLPPITAGGNQSSVVKLPTTLPAAGETGLLVLRVSGRIKALEGHPRPHMQLTVQCRKSDKTNSLYLSPWSPKTLAARSEWSDFSFCLPLYASQLPGKIEKVLLTTTQKDPREPQVEADRFEKASQFQLKDARVDISVLPGRPLAQGFVVF